MWVTERNFDMNFPSATDQWLAKLSGAYCHVLDAEEIPLRAVVTHCTDNIVRGEALVLSGADDGDYKRCLNQLRFVQRSFEDTSGFNLALIVPTGIGAEIGGHAGDAGPLVKLFASFCDAVVTHPNVVNASDVNELPANAFYVEGSVLSRLLLGNLALQPVRNNRVCVIIEDHPDQYFGNSAINAVNAARATYGFDCAEIIKVKHGVRLEVSYSSSGRASGEVLNLDVLLAALKRRRCSYDAVALSSVINVPAGYHQKYFDEAGSMINPWGGVEAMLTHTLSSILNVPTAHSPMFETREIANSDPGIVDSRMAAEAVSCTFFQSVLKGLQRSPRIIADIVPGSTALLDVTKINCLVIPDGCIGIPTLAGSAQGISVIAVKENRNVMRNDLRLLPWKLGQIHFVDNYIEAAGVVAALRAGISPTSVRRPFGLANVAELSSDINMNIPRTEVTTNHWQHAEASKILGD